MNFHSSDKQNPSSPSSLTSDSPSQGPEQVTVAAIQCELNSTVEENCALIESYVIQAAQQGAQIILAPELFSAPYFCKTQDDQWFAQALSFEENPLIERFQRLAQKHQVVLPLSFFEKDGPHYYNSVALINADGNVLGIYRKSHIPDGPGYQEKFYFRPGNTGFKVWSTAYGKVGVGICWDQWFPECARAMTLMGADLLFYPTAIGSEPNNPSLDTKDLWQRAMIGHAVSNVIPVVASNRIGNEDGQIFYGHSFISDHRGEKKAELDRLTSGVITSTFNFAQIQKDRASFGFFRDRRPNLYSSLCHDDTTIKSTHYLMKNYKA